VSDIVERLRATTLDKDNFSRMGSERWLPIGLANEAAAEIERLRAELAEERAMLSTTMVENLRAQLAAAAAFLDRMAERLSHDDMMTDAEAATECREMTARLRGDDADRR